MTRVKDGDIIKWYRDLLKNNTTALDRVYAWRRFPERLEDSPSINITLDIRMVERADEGGRGVDRTDRRMAIILLVRGVDDEDNIDDWVIDIMDDLEEEVRALVDYDYMPPSAPAGVMRVNLTEVRTEREEVNRMYAVRYLIFDVRTADKPERR